VNTLTLVRFDRNDYSVPTTYAHRNVRLVGSLDRVRISELMRGEYIEKREAVILMVTRAREKLTSPQRWGSPHAVKERRFGSIALPN